MSNTPVLTPSNNSVISKPSRTHSSWLRRLLYMSPVLVALLLIGCWWNGLTQEQQEYLNKLKNAKWVIENDEKIVFFIKQNFKYDDSLYARLNMTDEQRRALWLPTSENTKIEALVTLTPKERKALWVEKDYEEFLARLKPPKN